MKELVRWMSVPLSCFSLPDVQVGEMEHLHSFFKLYYFYSYLYGMYIKNILFKKLYLKKVRKCSNKEISLCLYSFRWNVFISCVFRALL